MEQEEWTSEVLNSFDGMQKAEPSPYLYSKIKSRLEVNVIEKIPVKWAFVTMSSLVLLFIINISFAKPYLKNTKTNENEEIIYEQQLINSDQIYQ